MPTPRYHPFFRLIIFSVGAVIATLFAGITLIALGKLVPWQPLRGDFGAQSLILTLLTYPFFLLWMWLCRRTFDLRSFVSLGLRRDYAVRDCLVGVACGAGAIALLFLVLLLTGHIQLGGSTGSIWSAELMESGAPVVGVQLLGWALAFMAVGFVEELSFRGYALHNLSAWMGVAAAIAVQAVFFALAHMANMVGNGESATLAVSSDALRAIPGLVLIAVFFAVSYLKTGSLWFPIGFHVAWNFFLGCIFSLPVSGIPVTRLLDVSVHGSPLVTGGEFGPEGSLLLLPIIVVMMILLARQPNHPQAELDLALLCPPRAPVEEEDDEPHTSRFKTSMKSRSEEIEPEIVDSLRQLSEAKAARRSQAQEIASMDSGLTGFTPPADPVATQPLETPGEKAEVPPIAASPAPITADVERVAPMKQTAEPSLPRETRPAAERVAPAERVEPSRPHAPSSAPKPTPTDQPRKPPAPRW